MMESGEAPVLKGLRLQIGFVWACLRCFTGCPKKVETEAALKLIEMAASHHSRYVFEGTLPTCAALLGSR